MLAAARACVYGFEIVAAQIGKTGRALAMATLETLERAVARTQKTVATLGELVAMIERGQGTVGALLNDAELFDDAKSLGKMLKNNPWRVVAPPPAEN